MAFIAGYIGKTPKYESARLEELVRSYCILPGVDSADYENVVMETKFGHIIQKYKKNYPVKSLAAKDNGGNLFASLGFVNNAGLINDNERLLNLCVSRSAGSLEQCEGEFVSVFWDGFSEVLHVVNDRFGSRPLYLARDNGRVCFSSNLGFLLYLQGAKHDIDVLGWMQIFSLGHLIGERTHLKDVKRMKPGSHLVFSKEGNIEETLYWRLEHRPQKNLNPGAHAQDVFSAFQSANAVRARIAGKGVVALSGGLDSRLVAGTLPKDVDYSAFTFVNSTASLSTPETKAAEVVCQALGLKHRIQPVAQQSFAMIAPQVIKLSGGLRPFHHMAIVMVYIDEIKNRGLDFLLGGGPGDVLAGSYIPSVDYLNSSLLHQCVSDFARGRVARSKGLDLLFRKDLISQYSGALQGSVLESFEGLGGPTAAHRVTAWAMVYRQPAFTFTSLIHTHPEVAEAFCHLDYAYSELMLKLPAEWLFDENFYSFMIYNCLPELRHIPYANTGELLSAELRSFASREPFAARAKSFALNRLKAIVHQSRVARKLIGRVRRRSPSLYLTLLTKDEKFCDEITDCLHSYGRLREILDTQRCMNFLEMCKNGNPPSGISETELLGSLATMCLSFKYLDL